MIPKSNYLFSCENWKIPHGIPGSNLKYYFTIFGVKTLKLPLSLSGSCHQKVKLSIFTENGGGSNQSKNMSLFSYYSNFKSFFILEYWGQRFSNASSFQGFSFTNFSFLQSANLLLPIQGRRVEGVAAGGAIKNFANSCNFFFASRSGHIPPQTVKKGL